MALYSVKPLYSASVTATSGSDIVQVTGSVNCSFLQSGAIVSISGSNRLVDAVSGTGVDGSGNSTIKLRRPWPGATITGQMLVFMSYEGLADAVFQLKSLIDAAAAEVEGAFSFKGDYDLAAAGALPPNPAEGAGSELWRISTSATIASVLYRVGDLIFYDQFLTVWRKVCENLGTAAYKNAQSSLTDTAADRLLLTGAFGIGATTLAAISDANSISATGFYTTGATWTGSPIAGTSGSNQGYLKHQSWANENYELQEYFSLTYAPQNYMWRLKDNGVWGAWNQVWSAANLVKQSSVNDVTAGRVLLTGAYGWGTAPTTGLDWNTLNYSSINISSTNAPAKAGTLTYMGLHIEGITAGQFSFDIAARNNRFFMQTKQSGAQQSWNELYHDKNILGTVSKSGAIPTGAIIERGSNANGEFTKFADGSMICRYSINRGVITYTAEGSLFVSTEIGWTFPAAFIGRPFAAAASVGNGQPKNCEITASTTTAINIRNTKALSGSDDTFINLYAFGYWI